MSAVCMQSASLHLFALVRKLLNNTAGGNQRRSRRHTPTVWFMVRLHPRYVYLKAAVMDGATANAKHCLQVPEAPSGYSHVISARCTFNVANSNLRKKWKKKEMRLHQKQKHAPSLQIQFKITTFISRLDGDVHATPSCALDWSSFRKHICWLFWSSGSNLTIIT